MTATWFLMCLLLVDTAWKESVDVKDVLDVDVEKLAVLECGAWRLKST
jgi:hypothetical protein